MKTNSAVAPAWDTACPLHSATSAVDVGHPDVTSLPFIGWVANITISPVHLVNHLTDTGRATSSIQSMLGHVTHVGADHVASGGFFCMPQFTHRVDGRVTTENGTTTVSDANISGTLDIIANKLTISEGCFINNLKLHCFTPQYLSPQFVQPFTGPCSREDGDSPRTAYGVCYEAKIGSPRQHNHAARLNIAQFVTLKPGAQLNNFCFSGSRCELTLEKGAHYNGIRWPGLYIIKS